MQNQNQQQATLQDKDMMNDLLTQEKQLIGTYGTFITEASCPNLRQVLENNMSETMQSQYQVFDKMRQRGWYKTDDAPDQKVQQTKQTMAQTRTSLGQ